MHIDYGTLEVKFNERERDPEYDLWKTSYNSKKNRLTITFNRNHPHYRLIIDEQNPIMKKAMNDCLHLYAASLSLAKYQPGNKMTNFSRNISIYSKVE